MAEPGGAHGEVAHQGFGHLRVDDTQDEGARRQRHTEELHKLAPARDGVTARYVGRCSAEALALVVSHTVCHSSSLEARPPRSHPATVGATPAEWLKKNRRPVAPDRPGTEVPPVGRRPPGSAGALPKTAGWSAPGVRARFSV
ncbi:hypothetical protein GCM10010216_54100 [Streptomyces flaveolus]|nr:hypothetical protein GCM10010216_54100 [Streptomyces flaveolus]